MPTMDSHRVAESDDLAWETVSSHTAWRGRFPVFVDVIRAHDGREMEYTHLGIGSGAVVVLALDDRDRAVCVRQYRHPMRGVTLELPAGHRDSGEDPLDAARREFEEETGYQLGRIEWLGDYTPVPSLAAFKMHMYVGGDLVAGSQQLEPNEVLEVVRVPIGELRAGILRGDYPAVALNYTVLLADARGKLPR